MTHSAGEPAIRATAPGRALAGLGVLLAAALAGCADVEAQLEPPPINPSSPIAPFAARVSAQTFGRQTFSQLPPKVEGLPPASAYKVEVVRQIHEKRALLAYWIAHPPEHVDTEDWAARQRDRIPRVEAAPVTAAHDAESEAFARRVREEAARPQ